jgi:hypothetical protein
MVPRIEHKIEDGIEKKRCCNCETYRSLDNYNNCKTSWDKLRPECKICLSEKRKINKDKMTEYNKKYWQETKEEQKIKSKEWRENNKEKVKENMTKWLEENKEYKKQKDKEYRELNWEKKKEYTRKWNIENYKDMKTNPKRADEFKLYKIKNNCARRIREMLQQNKSKRTIDYTGCSLEYLKVHLESKFQEGMTWDNYGKYKFGKDDSGWHIDHIIPCAAFNFEDEIEVKACFHYLNLQPLWGKDNIIKSDTFDSKIKEEYLLSFKTNTLDSL